MRTHTARRGTTLLVRAVAATVLMLTAGCSDILAVAGLSNLRGYWTGRYDAYSDFYLDLDDDAYGLYGRAGFTDGGGYVYVDGRRDGSRVVFYDADGYSNDPPLFEGTVTGSDRIDGVVYLGVPERVVLHRR